MRVDLHPEVPGFAWTTTFLALHYVGGTTRRWECSPCHIGRFSSLEATAATSRREETRRFVLRTETAFLRFHENIK